ncbi:hypothetical protein TRICI_000721 [Trichomonascus ciferrii]|uniref:AB hydrolase-1 domain-containing protein n=1 Tax=Trichomonascus ciferrii TaxID=44093 RepID=A0A642VCU5_9ASCO|nr:hypothetical protein TRICI_000721 [Trichomonascus ciferrii]
MSPETRRGSKELLKFRLFSNSTSSVDVLEETRRDQTVTLSDGRVLGYAEYGAQDGIPLLYFHGYPSSRFEGWSFGDWPRRNRLRLIVPDRPGFGLSSYQPNRSILDWPADVRQLVSHLGLSRFAVLGCSGGGPYAVACAYLLPADMLSGVGVLAGAPPWVAGTGDVTLTRKVLSRAAINCPRALEAVLDPLFYSLRWIIETGPVTRRLDGWIESMQLKKPTELENVNEDHLTAEDIRKRLLSTYFEAFAQNSRAVVQEAGLLSQDWGFPLNKVAYSGIRIWHGRNDTSAPIAMIRYMADQLPQPVFHELDANHNTTGHYLERAINELINTPT